MAESMHPLAPEHLPFFITGPGQTDTMLVSVGLFIVGMVLLVGVFYLHLHSLPDRLAHKANSTQLQVVGILTLLALFTHNNIFWVAALLLVAIQFPDFITPLNSIARSLEKATSEKPEPTERADHV